MEHGAEDVDVQVDQAVLWYFHETESQNYSQLKRRKRFVRNHTDFVSQKHVHSSAGTKKNLSLEGEQCLEQFYQKDYEILEAMMDTACKTHNCRKAIKNILHRRKYYSPKLLLVELKTFGGRLDAGSLDCFD